SCGFGAMTPGALGADALGANVPRRGPAAASQAWMPAGPRSIPARDAVASGAVHRRKRPRVRGALGYRVDVARYSSGTSSSATMLMILIKGLIAGPAVSLYG